MSSTNPLDDPIIAAAYAREAVNLSKVNIPGTGDVYTEYDWTRYSVTAKYNEYMAVIFNPGSSTTQIQDALEGLSNLAKYGMLLYIDAGNTSTPPTPTDANPIPAGTKRYYLTATQASDLSVLMNSFKAAATAEGETGYIPGVSPMTTDILTSWRTDLGGAATVSSTGKVQGALWNLMLQYSVTKNTDGSYTVTYNGPSASLSSTSLQSMIELIYVKTGSDVINSQMTSLQNALTITQDVLNTLGSIQDIHNQLSVYGVGTINFNYDTGKPSVGADAIVSINDYQSNYQNAASSYFGKPLAPQVLSTLVRYGSVVIGYRNAAGEIVPTGDPAHNIPVYGRVATSLTDSGTSYFNKLLSLRNNLSGQISRLSATTSASVRNDPNSLYATLKVVLSDLKTNFAIQQYAGGSGASTQFTTTAAGASFNNMQRASALSRWILDRYNLTSTSAALLAGNIQQNITTAITAGQSLNDTQKESVRNYLFVFEQYYQSASTILQSLTQIIQNMAQNIARG